MAIDLKDSILGSLLGSAMGDALGLPCEGLSKRRQARMFPEIDGYHFFLGRGMVSDDAQHAVLVAQALTTSAGDNRKFASLLAWGLRRWFLTLPAGVGLATLRAIIKLWLGFSAKNSGVFSAGNGPAMRSAIIGVCYGAGPPDKLKDLVRISTGITHKDPKAFHGALAVALAAWAAGQYNYDRDEYLKRLQACLGPEAEEFIGLVIKAAESAAAGQSTEDFARKLGQERGVSGYIFHTVPVVLQAWFRWPRDFSTAIKAVIRCGGDTDTTASILGGIMGAGLSQRDFAPHLLEKLWLWPMSLTWLESLSRKLAETVETGQSISPPGLFFPFELIRGLFFMSVVLAHGFRRLLPPYF